MLASICYGRLLKQNQLQKGLHLPSYKTISTEVKESLNTAPSVSSCLKYTKLCAQHKTLFYDKRYYAK